MWNGLVLGDGNACGLVSNVTKRTGTCAWETMERLGEDSNGTTDVKALVGITDKLSEPGSRRERLDLPKMTVRELMK